jgi:hypothetical protein
MAPGACSESHMKEMLSWYFLQDSLSESFYNAPEAGPAVAYYFWHGTTMGIRNVKGIVFLWEKGVNLGEPLR